MSFVDLTSATAIATLKSAHYSFPRATRLREGMGWMVTDYYAKAVLRRPFEARGLLVTGPSRIGKTTEIRKQLDALNDGSTKIPDGRSARFVSVVLKGLLSWKDLGIHTAAALRDMPVKQARSMGTVVLERLVAELRGVPAAVVEQERQRLADWSTQLAGLREQRAKL